MRESQRRRFSDVAKVDEVIALDAEWRSVRYELDQCLKDLNAISKEVGQIKKARDRSTWMTGLCQSFSMSTV